MNAHFDAVEHDWKYKGWIHYRSRGVKLLSPHFLANLIKERKPRLLIPPESSGRSSDVTVIKGNDLFLECIAEGLWVSPHYNLHLKTRDKNVQNLQMPNNMYVLHSGLSLCTFMELQGDLHVYILSPGNNNIYILRIRETCHRVVNILTLQLYQKQNLWQIRAVLLLWLFVWLGDVWAPRQSWIYTVLYWNVHNGWFALYLWQGAREKESTHLWHLSSTANQWYSHLRPILHVGSDFMGSSWILPGRLSTWTDMYIGFELIPHNYSTSRSTFKFIFKFLTECSLKLVRGCVIISVSVQ